MASKKLRSFVTLDQDRVDYELWRFMKSAPIKSVDDYGVVYFAQSIESTGDVESLPADSLRQWGYRGRLPRHGQCVEVECIIRPVKKARQSDGR